MNETKYNEKIIEVVEEIWRDYLFDENGQRACVCWVGAGLSKTSNEEYKINNKKGMGYPLFNELIEILKERCKPEKAYDDAFLTAEECFKANKDVFYDTLSEIFSIIDDSARYINMYLLNLPFYGFVTSNFDPTLNELSKLIGSTIKRKVQFYPKLKLEDFYKERSIAYIHGCALNGVDNLLLTHSRLSAEYKLDAMVGGFLRELFTEKRFLFLGCRVSEPELKQLFEKTISFNLKYGAREPKRAILLSEDSCISTDYLNNLDAMKIEVIRYPLFEVGNRHQALNDIIRSLWDKSESMDESRNTENILSGERVIA